MASIEYGEEVTKCFERMEERFERMEESYAILGETMRKLINQMCQIPSTKQTHPTTTKEEQIIHIDESQTMAPPNEKSMKMGMVVGDQADMSEPIMAKMKLIAIVGQTLCSWGSNPHLMWSPKKKKIVPTLFSANTSMLSAPRFSRRTKLGISLNGGSNLSTLNFKKRKRIEC